MRTALVICATAIILALLARNQELAVRVEITHRLDLGNLVKQAK